VARGLALRGRRRATPTVLECLSGAIRAPGGAAAIRATLLGMHSTDETSESGASGVELDADQLSPGALRGLVEEYVTREGTDYGEGNWSLEDKVAQVFRQLERGEARIVFDLDSESASIVTAPELALHVLDPAVGGGDATDQSARGTASESAGFDQRDPSDR